MLLQAYDFLHLFDDARLPACSSGRATSGATSPWASSSSARRVGRRCTGSPPPSCSRPTGRSSGRPSPGRSGSMPRRTSPYQLYQFFYRTEDSVVGDYLRYFTFLDHDAIRALDADTAEHPERREAQRALAREVCTLVHGGDEAARAEAAALALYSGELASLDEAVAARGVRRDAHLDPGAHRARRAGLVARRRARRHRPGHVEEPGPHPGHPGRGVRERPREKDTDARLGPSDLLFGRYLVLRRGAGLPSRVLRVTAGTRPSHPPGCVHAAVHRDATVRPPRAGGRDDRPPVGQLPRHHRLRIPRVPGRNAPSDRVSASSFAPWARGARYRCLVQVSRGGEVGQYTKLLEDSRRHAIDRLVENARIMGANAIVGCASTRRRSARPDRDRRLRHGGRHRAPAE